MHVCGVYITNHVMDQKICDEKKRTRKETHQKNESTNRHYLQKNTEEKHMKRKNAVFLMHFYMPLLGQMLAGNQ